MGANVKRAGLSDGHGVNPAIVQSRVSILILLIPTVTTFTDGMPGRCVCVNGHRHRKNRAHLMLKEQCLDGFVKEIKRLFYFSDTRHVYFPPVYSFVGFG